MPKIAVKIEGLEELKRNLSRYPEISIPIVNKAIRNSIATILNKTIPITPVDTRVLANSLQAGMRFRDLYGEVGTEVGYSGAVHGLHSPGVPYKNPSKNKRAVAGFLQVGADQSESEFDKFFDEALSEILENISD